MSDQFSELSIKKLILWAITLGTSFPNPLAGDTIFDVGEPETIVTHSEQREKDLAYIDSGISLVKIGDRNVWLCTEHDKSNNEEGQVVSEGQLENPFETISRRNLRINGVPELRGPQDEPGNACWIGSAYYDPESDAILAFIHLEFWPPKGLRRKYMRFGLAVSTDGGKSFDWCGYIVSPDLPYEAWSNRWVKSGQSYPGSINMGWPNYIMKDGFFHLYYRDSRELPDRVEGGMAVARAPMREVIDAALKREVTPWHKFHEGDWSEPGLGGKFTVILDDRGLMHGDAAYCEPLGQYVLIVRDAKGKEDTVRFCIRFHATDSSGRLGKTYDATGTCTTTRRLSDSAQTMRCWETPSTFTTSMIPTTRCRKRAAPLIGTV